MAYKNEARNELQTLLRNLGLYVESVAEGNEAILVSSGFDLAKSGGSGIITNPQNPRLITGPNAGELTSIVDGVKRCKSYVHELTEYPITESSTWLPKPSSDRQVVFMNLVPGKKYAMRVAAIGAKNQIMYSTIVTQIAI